MVEGASVGKASLTEMESDLCAVDGLRSSVLVKLQELSIGGEKKAPVSRRSPSFGVLQSPHSGRKRELENALKLLRRDSLQKYIDEGAVIILE